MTDSASMSPEDQNDPLMSRRRFLCMAGAVTGLGMTGARSTGRMSEPATQTKAFLDRFRRIPPFSFQYGGQHSQTLLASWPPAYRATAIDADQTMHVFTWAEPRTGLVVRCEVVEYHDYPTLDWTIHFRNAGAQHSPLLQGVLALDAGVQVQAQSDVVVRTCNGSAGVTQDYQLQEIGLPAPSSLLFTCMGGRPTNGTFRQESGISRAGSPYYNLDCGGEGIIVVIGWPGQWVTEIGRDAGATLLLRAGMSTQDGTALQQGDHVFDAGLVDLSLLPGEEIRTPRVVIQFWQGGDWIAAQNTWRRWMLAHNMPRTGGRLPAPMCPAQSSGYGPSMLGITAQGDLATLANYAADHIATATGGVVDHWWIDAGWYEVPSAATDWTWTGTWSPDPTRYPHGLRPVTNRARSAGMRSIVWAEPERVRPGTWLYQHHPEWLLGPGPDGDNMLLNLGNPQAWTWVVEHFDRFIRDQGVDVYRQDFNMDPLAYWNMTDPPGRTGSTQIRHVTGFLAYWDELRRRHPGLLIDCCASGGRRNDLETVRRAVPLWRSDDNGPALDEQCHTYGSAFWLPYSGSGIPFGASGAPGDMYTLRSGMLPSFMIFLEVAGGLDAEIKQALGAMREWQVFAADLLGDYYPLTPYSLDTDVWMAWQFNLPEAGTGVVQAFRRDTSTVDTMRFRLRGLDADARYELRNFDSARRAHESGRELMTSGVAVKLGAPASAATITYRRS